MKLGPWTLPTYAIGDCRDLLRALPDECVHCVVTSPPYWGLRDYGTGRDQLGLEAHPDEYVARLVAIFRQVRRVLRRDGTLWLNLGDTYIAHINGRNRNPETQRCSPERTNLGKEYLHSEKHGKIAPNRRPVAGLKNKDLAGIPWRVALALQADGWWLRSDVIWAKPSPIPESVTDRPTRAHEYLFLLGKAERYFYDHEAIRDRYADGPGGRNKRSVWQIAAQPYHGDHYATFPQRLVEPCILAGTSPWVCGVCGAPWSRLTEVSYSSPGRTKSIARRHTSPGFRRRLSRTIGWEPTCEHQARTGQAVVLDPFFGSGTTGLVAEQHGRLWIGFENNPACGPLIEERISKVQQRLRGLS